MSLKTREKEKDRDRKTEKGRVGEESRQRKETDVASHSLDSWVKIDELA